MTQKDLSKPDQSTPQTVTVSSPGRQRALWTLLSPLLLLGVLALMMRLGSGANAKPGAGNSEADAIAAQPPEKVNYVDTSTQKQLEDTVVGQLSALRHHDFDAAYRFAHKPFRDHWTVPQFQHIIESSGFAIMPVSSRQECRKALRTNNMTTILVTVRKADGDGAGFVYSMVQEDGKWRIAACTHALDPAIAQMPE